MPGRTTARGCGNAHQKARRRVLARDPICTEPGCRRPSTIAHHEPPLSERTEGSPHDPRGMRGVCRPCHAKLTALEREHRRALDPDEELGPAPPPPRGKRRQLRRVWVAPFLAGIELAEPAEVIDTGSGEASSRPASDVGQAPSRAREVIAESERAWPYQQDGRSARSGPVPGRADLGRGCRRMSPGRPAADRSRPGRNRDWRSTSR